MTSSICVQACDGAILYHSFHKKLKTSLLNGKVNRRVDFLIDALLRIERDNLRRKQLFEINYQEVQYCIVKQRVRTSILQFDCGTEHVLVASTQCALRENHNDPYTGEKSFRFGKSTELAEN